MTLLVTGTIAIDSIITPFGELESCLGGSATYFSVAAGHFTWVFLVGAVGEDFPEDYLKIFDGRPIDTTGLEKRPGSLTFRWKGSYAGAMNEARTLDTQLNVIAEEPPTIPEKFRHADFVFLANTAPDVQLKLLRQVKSPQLSMADTMNYWIQNNRDDLLKLIDHIDSMVLNDTEARMFTGQDNLITAAADIVQMGLEFIVIKKGEHGTLLMTKDKQCFVLPAYPTADVKDPTGAGDSFAGGMMGYLAAQNAFDLTTLKKAIAYGTVTASLVIEDFSLRRWHTAARPDIDQRYRQLKEMMQFK
ncbi:MAG: sugar kinase [Phycisphaerae bacterium SM23_30]|nr:MAG: sugar kinase [Phycisphaerae bacterium SM23_30]